MRHCTREARSGPSGRKSTARSEFCARHCGCREAAPAPRGSDILLTSRRKPRRGPAPLPPGFYPALAVWRSMCRARGTGRSGRVCHGRSCKGHRSAVVAAGASAPAIDTQHLLRMTLGRAEPAARGAGAVRPAGRHPAAAHPARGAGGGRGVGPHLEGLGGRHRRLQGGPRRRSGRAGPRLRGRDAAVAAAIDTLAAVLDEAKAEIARLLRV